MTGALRSYRVPGGMGALVVVDPGLSTGVAYFEGNLVVENFTTSAPHTQLESYLRAIKEQNGTLEVLCEQGPTNHRRQADACVPVETIVKQEADVIHWVRPSDWKGHPAATLRASDRPATRHERDVLRMGRWFLATRSGSLVFPTAA